MIACFTRNKVSYELRREFIFYLLENCAANVNVCNQNTLFTPLHWLARYGDTKLIEKFLSEQHEGIAFLPDRNAVFPLDYAGRFQHHETVAFLIRHGIQVYQKLIKEEGAKKGV